MNNHYIDLNSTKFPTETVPLIEILKSHYLFYAIIGTKNIPGNYITQVWLSAKYEKLELDGRCVIGYASHPSIEKTIHLGFNKAVLRDKL